MNENLNLFEILKKYYNNETLYSPLMGSVKVNLNTCPDELWVRKHGCCVKLTEEGKFNEDGELMLFPSKNQHNWNKWAEEKKIKNLKTWDALADSKYVKQINVSTHVSHDYDTHIEKSVQALLRIRQLIDISYGGVPTMEYRINLVNPIYVIDYFNSRKEWYVIAAYNNTLNHIAFYTKEQAEEFISYPENVELLKEYYML